MVIEVRTYRVTPNKRDLFLKTFKNKSIPEMERIGIRVFGPLVDMENPNKFVWLRCFPDMSSREKLKSQFYEGKVWKDEIQNELLPILDGYDFQLCKSTSKTEINIK